MAISYTDSVKQNTKLRASRAYQSIAEDFPAAYGSEDWTLDSRYKYCPEYHDDNVVMIDDQKSVSAKTSKIVVTQGANSEFVPFELERYYDGFDLCNTIITIHFLNKNGFDDYANPINVYYCDDKIRLGWLIDNKVTAVEGIVQFEIEAVGQNSGGERYEWRTRPSDCINVLKSISGNGPIKPDSNWVVDLIGRLQNTESEIEELKSKIGDVPSAAVEVDPTLTKDGMAADAKAVGDRIDELPIQINEDTGYTEIVKLPRATNISNTVNGNTLKVASSLQDGRWVSGTVMFGKDGMPESYAEDGVECKFGFTGFDLSCSYTTEEERLVGKIVISDSNLSSFVFDMDVNNNSIYLKRAFLRISSTLATQIITANVTCYDSAGKRVFGYTSNVAETRPHLHRSWLEQKPYGYLVSMSNTDTPLYALSDDISESVDLIARISISTSSALPLESTIELWGVGSPFNIEVAELADAEEMIF